MEVIRKRHRLRRQFRDIPSRVHHDARHKLVVAALDKPQQLLRDVLLEVTAGYDDELIADEPVKRHADIFHCLGDIDPTDHPVQTLGPAKEPEVPNGRNR